MKNLKQEYDKKIEQLEEKLAVYSRTMGEYEKRRHLEEKPSKVNSSVTCFEPPVFDGKSTWPNYLKQFEAAAKVNGWTLMEKTAALILSLRGEAIDILQTLKPEDQEDYGQLVERLNMRYGHAHLQPVYETQLSGRCQMPHENLQEFEADVTRLVHLAYPESPDSLLNCLATQTFINGIQDIKIQQALRLKLPKTSREALSYALEHEAAKEATRIATRRREMIEESKDEEQKKNEDLEEKIHRIAAEVKNGFLRCLNCRKLGHSRQNCDELTVKDKRRRFRQQIEAGVKKLPSTHNVVVSSKGLNKSVKERPTSYPELTTVVRRMTVVNDRWHSDELREDQEKDKDLTVLLNWKKNNGRPTWENVAPHSQTVKSYWVQWDSIVLEDGILKRVMENTDGTEKRTQLIIPRSRVPEVLEEIHGGSRSEHFGVKSTLRRLRQRFYWVNCKEEVKEWCKKCVACAKSYRPHKRRETPIRQHNVGINRKNEHAATVREIVTHTK